MYLMNDMNMSRYQLEAKVRQQAKGIWAPLLTTSLTRNIVTLKIKFSSYLFMLAIHFVGAPASISESRGLAKSHNRTIRLWKQPQLQKLFCLPCSKTVFAV